MIADETAPSHHHYQDHLSAYANMSSHHDYQDHLRAAFINRGMGVLVEKGGFTPLEFDGDHSKNVGCGLEVMGLRVSQDCAVRSRGEVEAGKHAALARVVLEKANFACYFLAPWQGVFKHPMFILHTLRPRPETSGADRFILCRIQPERL